MIFGCGVEMAGVTVSKAIVKWFKGKELALAMGIEMAIARLGVFAVFSLSPRIAQGIHIDKSVLFATLLLVIGFICVTVYTLMDRKLDKQLGESGIAPDDPFRISDIGKLFTSKTFYWWPFYVCCIIRLFSPSRNLLPICWNAGWVLAIKRQATFSVGSR